MNKRHWIWWKAQLFYIGLNTNCPVPPDGGAEQYDISNDGESVVFTG